MTSAAPVRFFLAIRSHVVIAAPAPRIWSYLDRPQEWKPSIVAIERLRGARGAEGEQLRVAQRPGNQTVHMLMETVRLEPPVWRVQTLVTESSRTTDGFVIYSLDSAGNTVQLVCEVVARCEMQADMLGQSPVEEFVRRINEDTRQKLDADLLRLKTLSERPG